MTDLRNLKKNRWPFLEKNNDKKKMYSRAARSSIWTHSIAPTKYARSHRRQSTKNYRPFRSKMAMSVVVSRKSRADNTDQPVGSNSALMPYVNRQMSAFCHVINEQNVRCSNVNTANNRGIFKNVDRKAKEVKRIEHLKSLPNVSSITCSSNETMLSNSVRQVVHNERTTEFDDDCCTTLLNHKLDIYSNTTSYMTSDLFIPAAASSRIFHNTDNLQSEELTSKSSIVSLDSNNSDSGTNCNNFVLNVAKATCSDNRMNMSAFELLTFSNRKMSSSPVYSLHSQMSDRLNNSSDRNFSSRSSNADDLHDKLDTPENESHNNVNSDCSETDVYEIEETINLDCSDVKITSLEDDTDDIENYDDVESNDKSDYDDDVYDEGDYDGDDDETIFNESFSEE